MITKNINIKNAHANAKKILNSEFHWNNTNEAWDAKEIFKEEKKIDKTDFPIILITEYFEKCQWDDFNLYETDFSVIERFNEQKSGSDEYWASYESYEETKDEMRGYAEINEHDISEWESLFDANFEGYSQCAASIQIDNFIIAVCFLYFYLNGFISKELWEITKVALEREIDFNSICKFPYNERDGRLEDLKVLKGDLLKMEVYIK